MRRYGTVNKDNIVIVIVTYFCIKDINFVVVEIWLAPPSVPFYRPVKLNCGH